LPAGHRESGTQIAYVDEAWPIAFCTVTFRKVVRPVVSMPKDHFVVRATALVARKVEVELDEVSRIEAEDAGAQERPVVGVLPSRSTENDPNGVKMP
jgi:hypothetical protein